MDFVSFCKENPILFGQITVNGNNKIGQFRLKWNKYTNSFCYSYYTENGRKGSGGFSLKRAFSLLCNNQLSTNPDNGIKANYL